MCYNTGHEFNINAEFDQRFARSRDCADASEKGCILDLSQLLDRIERTPLQGGLQEVRLLFKLLRFLLISRKIERGHDGSRYWPIRLFPIPIHCFASSMEKETRMLPPSGRKIR